MSQGFSTYPWSRSGNGSKRPIWLQVTSKCIVTVCVSALCAVVNIRVLSLFNCVIFNLNLWNELNEYVFYGLFAGISFCQTVTDHWNCEVCKLDHLLMHYCILYHRLMLCRLCYHFTFLRVGKGFLCEFFFEKLDNFLLNCILIQQFMP
jgi:hypothetical protein